MLKTDKTGMTIEKTYGGERNDEEYWTHSNCPKDDGSAYLEDGVCICCGQWFGEKTMEIQEVTESLYHKYPQQHQPQDCYVELDCDSETLTADWNGEIGNGVPFNVWHYRTLRWAIPPLKIDAANALLERLAPLCQEIIDGYDTRWDGNNWVGDYTDEAMMARDQVAEICLDADQDWDNMEKVWDVRDWFEYADLPINSNTEDDRLEELAEEYEAEIETQGETVNGDILEYLTEHRDYLRDRDPEWDNRI